MKLAIDARHRLSLRLSRAQALVELALVTPLLFGIIAVLFQFGILFISYLAIIHETRDISRWLSVHPDTLDSAALTQARADASSVIDSTRMNVTFSPACATQTNSHCTSRTTGSMLTITVTYDPSNSIFLPTNLRLGPWLRFDMPSSLSTQTYDYSLMVEPH
jgi:hypothetical protein